MYYGFNISYSYPLSHLNSLSQTRILLPPPHPTHPLKQIQKFIKKNLKHIKYIETNNHTCTLKYPTNSTPTQKYLFSPLGYMCFINSFVYTIPFFLHSSFIFLSFIPPLYIHYSFFHTYSFYLHTTFHPSYFLPPFSLPISKLPALLPAKVPRHVPFVPTLPACLHDITPWFLNQLPVQQIDLLLLLTLLFVYLST